MRARAFIMLGVAAVMGVAAVFLARGWIETQMAARQPVAVAAPAAPALEVTTVVVARSPLRFGNRIGSQHVKEVDWPASAVPPGAFTSIEEFLGEEGERVVLQAMEENEPVLASKVTGGGERASLSAIIEPGMRAVTIRVNDVLGVAGFVLPGDRVDIMLTRELDESPVTDVLLQNVKVLGIDQDANEKRNEPGVARSITLEVSTVQAQKLTLASRVGSLSLTLRNVANVETEQVRRINLNDLNVVEAINSADPTAPAVKKRVGAKKKTLAKAPVAAAVEVDPYAKIGITRGLARREYNVTPEETFSVRPLELLPRSVLPLLPEPILPPALPEANPEPATPLIPARDEMAAY